ncbi:MAG: 50S ribosomal protein L11 methyltransferase [Lautropia sp.]
MTQQWLEAVVEVARDEAEAWADACIEAGALSVRAEDADADSADEQPLFGEPRMANDPPAANDLPGFGWERTRLAVMFNGGTDPQALVNTVAAALGRPAPPLETVSVIQEQDWVRATQSQFTPIPIGERLLVVPSWHLAQLPAEQSGRVALIIDPGLAFGTGSHPTTRMCLEWLEQADLAGKRVIDYGCGSGILAIAATKLGAARAIGIDIDPQALASAKQNAQVNQVELELQSSADPLPPPADIVVANILSNPLKLLAPMLASLVAPGGALVLSGVLERQIEEVSVFYDESVAVAPWRTQDGWVCLAGKRAVDGGAVDRRQ